MMRSLWCCHGHKGSVLFRLQSSLAMAVARAYSPSYLLG